ncbi:AAA family ATPase [Labrys miyagiensis]
MASKSQVTEEVRRARAPARIEYLRVENYRALKSLELKRLTPLTALLGPNGSGKSTIFDVFAFLSECFDTGLRRAWEKRGRARELDTRINPCGMSRRLGLGPDCGISVD